MLFYEILFFTIQPSIYYVTQFNFLWRRYSSIHWLIFAFRQTFYKWIIFIKYYICFWICNLFFNYSILIFILRSLGLLCRIYILLLNILVWLICNVLLLTRLLVFNNIKTTVWVSFVSNLLASHNGNFKYNILFVCY